MKQSTSFHVAIVMDGNGRWATRRGLSRAAGPPASAPAPATMAAERGTPAGTRLELRIAVDYSARDAIRSGSLLPDVDLLIRTGGEQRLSDFLLWECAYAELWFTDRMWPDFGAPQLAAALHEFHSRDRRFG